MVGAVNIIIFEKTKQSSNQIPPFLHSRGIRYNSSYMAGDKEGDACFVYQTDMVLEDATALKLIFPHVLLTGK
jgi:hypothetical protein